MNGGGGVVVVDGDDGVCVCVCVVVVCPICYPFMVEYVVLFATKTMNIVEL